MIWHLSITTQRTNLEFLTDNLREIKIKKWRCETLFVLSTTLVTVTLQKKL